MKKQLDANPNTIQYRLRTERSSNGGCTFGTFVLVRSFSRVKLITFFFVLVSAPFLHFDFFLTSPHDKFSSFLLLISFKPSFHRSILIFLAIISLSLSHGLFLPSSLPLLSSLFFRSFFISSMLSFFCSLSFHLLLLKLFLVYLYFLHFVISFYFFYSTPVSQTWMGKSKGTEKAVVRGELVVVKPTVRTRIVCFFPM